ncbi:putative Ig domain-containing protein [Subtercola endophyticus]|uniref:putative Ig domain-containing protein n=1 Tax=Subtercola endophyticus TaxID=2895559 RepID=UPI001E40D2BD|nr:putative Ig domain-containing protein [Subtercola endophyticus]UFS57566.1 hypothetical protein LQ955_10880 [Subtercola endophyticus]
MSTRSSAPAPLRRVLRAVAIAACAAVIATGGSIAAAESAAASVPSAAEASTLTAPAASAPTATAASASTVAAPAAPTAAVNTINVLKDIQIQVRNAPDSWGQRHDARFTIGVAADGRVKFEIDGSCLDTWSLDGFPELRTFAVPDDCREDPSQYFYLVPSSPTPVAGPTPDHEAARDNDQWFAIVSSSGKECLSSKEGGLFPANGSLPDDIPQNFAQQKKCDPADPKQQFRVADEYWEDNVPARWTAILNTAITYATQQCGSTTQSTPENAPCLVKFANDPQQEWLIPGRGRALTMGTAGTVLLGCGTGADKNLPKQTNLTGRDESITVGSTAGYDHTVQWGAGLGIKVSVEAKNSYSDIMSVTYGGEFSINGSFVDTRQDHVGNSQSYTQTVADGMTLMNVWQADTVNLTGTWKLDIGTPAVRPGAMAWTIPASSTLPITGGLTNTAIATRSNKSCTATPASTNTQRPWIVSGTNTCATPPTPTQTSSGMVDTVLTACPGTWTTGADSTARVYSYEWYTKPAGSTAETPIPNETGPTLRVIPSLYKAGQDLYVGVNVREEGPTTRLESAPVRADLEALVVARTGTAPDRFATNFTGWLPDAHTRMPYSQKLVTSPGTRMNLTTNQSALRGLTMSPDGLLSGTPTSTGEVTFTVTDTPGDGGPVTTRDFTLRVFDRDPTALGVASTSLTATVGTPFSAALLADPAAGQTAAVAPTLVGDIAGGLAFDPATGILSGTPTEDGVTLLTLVTPEFSQTFTLTTTDVATVLSTAPLPSATVGVPYSAATAVSLGTDVQIGRLPAVQPGENGVPLDTDPAAPAGQPRVPSLLGLTLDAATGQLSGTPTEAGTVVIAVANLTDASTPAQLKTLTVAAAASTSTPPAGSSTPAPAAASKPSHLAATGWSAGLAVPFGVAVLLLGALLFALRRRSRLR